MFGNWSLGPRSGASLANIKKHRGPLSFPAYYVPTDVVPFTHPETERNFTTYFSKVRRITDLTVQHLGALGVVLHENADYKELFTGELPAEVYGEEQKAQERERIRELKISNEKAFKVLSREARDEKLGHMYKFYQSVELVEPYYDLTAESSPADAAAADQPAQPPAAAAGDIVQPTAETDDDFSLPEKFREDLIVNFIDPLGWQWQLRTYIPRAPPKVALKNILYNVHITTHFCATPQNTDLARRGISFGPLGAIQVRHEHSFRAIRDANAMILRRRRAALAASATAPAPPPGADRASKSKRPRISSRSAAKKKDDETKKKTPAGEIIEDDDDFDLNAKSGMLSFVAVDGRETEVDVIGLGREVAAALHVAQGRRVQPASRVCGLMTNESTMATAPWDDVFVVTGRHHHVSITKVRVHEKYLEVLKKGGRENVELTGEEDEGWEKLHVWRTPYWSLLKVEERVQAGEAMLALFRELKSKLGVEPMPEKK